MKKNNNKGFTLMEMLIVVAIIAVLVAIAIPVFTNSWRRPVRLPMLLIFVLRTLSALLLC